MIEFKFALALTAAVVGLLGSAPHAAAADLFVIANPKASVTSGDIRDIFLGEKQFAGATKLIPVDNSALQAEFLDKVLKLDQGKYSTHWTKKGFRDGLNAPTVLSGDAAVIDFVKQAAGGGGDVRAAPAGANVVGKF